MSSSQSEVFCPHCRGKFKKRGLTNHIRIAHRGVQNSNDVNDSVQIASFIQNENDNLEEIEPDQIETMFLRAYGAPMINSNGDVADDVWQTRWRMTMKLRGKQYQLPQGAVGRQFVSQLAEEIQSVAENRHVSERFLFFCSVVLQREKMIRSGTDIRRLIRKRLDMWRDGKFDELLNEALRCDRQLNSNDHKVIDEVHRVRIFTRLVLQGKLRDATRWITDRDQCGVLNLHDTLEDGKTVFQALKEKHPERVAPDLNAFIECENLPTLVVVDISANHIEKIARQIRGGAGPSGTDAESWSAFLLRYGNHSATLRESVASLTRYIANGIVEWKQIRGMLARRGVALDKCPGVRPVGVGEVIQRICAKTMALTTGEDVQEICGAQQLCSGIKSGLEGAIQGFSSLFDDDDTEGILLVDARNAFNVLNRQVALWNVRILWPRCCRFLFNTYRGFSIIMFRNSDETLLSMEGTTQGDPLAMLFYGIGVMPLIKKLMSPDWVQNWYADDSACIGKLSMIRKWIDLLRIEGPKYGYYPEPNKSFLVIKPQFLEEASLLFHDLHVQIVTEKRFLGGVIGNGDEKKNYVKEKVNQWIDCVKKLSEAAKKSPQAAFSVVTKSLQCEWAFLQRVVNHCQDEYIPLREIIHSTLVPSIFEHEISSSEHELFHLPTRFGGLGINDPVETAQHAFAVTSEKCKVLVDSLLKQEQLNLQEHNQCVKNAINTELVRKETEYQEKQERILSSLPPAKQRVLTRIVEGKSSQWLNVIPKSSDNFDLSPVQFRDALALPYNHGLKGLPTYCDGCGGEMSVTHALNCKKGGLVKHGHDYLRDECIMMASYAWNGIVKEPIMRDSSSTSPALIADFKINGVWEAGGTAFFDNRIVNADAPSYSSQTWNTIAKRHAQEKHLKYNTAAEDLRASFTPLVCSTDGALHLEFHSFLKRIALVLSEKWKKMYGHVLSWLRVRTEFSILKAVSLRLRGTRQIVKPYGFDDGAGLMYIVD